MILSFSDIMPDWELSERLLAGKGLSHSLRKSCRGGSEPTPCQGAEKRRNSKSKGGILPATKNMAAKSRLCRVR